MATCFTCTIFNSFDTAQSAMADRVFVGFGSHANAALNAFSGLWAAWFMINLILGNEFKLRDTVIAVSTISFSHIVLNSSEYDYYVIDTIRDFVFAASQEVSLQSSNYSGNSISSVLTNVEGAMQCVIGVGMEGVKTWDPGAIVGGIALLIPYMMMIVVFLAGFVEFLFMIFLGKAFGPLIVLCATWKTTRGIATNVIKMMMQGGLAVLLGSALGGLSLEVLSEFSGMSPGSCGGGWSNASDFFWSPDFIGVLIFGFFCVGMSLKCVGWSGQIVGFLAQATTQAGTLAAGFLAARMGVQGGAGAAKFMAGPGDKTAGAGNGNPGGGGGTAAPGGGALMPPWALGKGRNSGEGVGAYEGPKVGSLGASGGPWGAGGQKPEPWGGKPTPNPRGRYNDDVAGSSGGAPDASAARRDALKASRDDAAGAPDPGDGRRPSDAASPSSAPAGSAGDAAQSATPSTTSAGEASSGGGKPVDFDSVASQINESKLDPGMKATLARFAESMRARGSAGDAGQPAASTSSAGGAAQPATPSATSAGGTAQHATPSATSAGGAAQPATPSATSVGGAAQSATPSATSVGGAAQLATPSATSVGGAAQPATPSATSAGGARQPATPSTTSAAGARQPATPSTTSAAGAAQASVDEKKRGGSRSTRVAGKRIQRSERS